jgi:hypothetical protein
LQRLNDPGDRLVGENPSTATVREMLELCQRYASHSEPEVGRAVRETDVILLEIQVSRLEQKRDYWKIRAAELSGNGRRGGPD